MNRVSVTLHFKIGILALLTGLVGPVSIALAAPPTLTVPGSQTVQEGQLLTFNVSAVDPEGQSILLYTTSRPSGSTFSDHHNGTGTFSWTPNQGSAGSYGATFVADDGFGGTDTKSVAISVVVGNDAPVLFAIGDRTVERGTQLILSLTGYDPNGDALTYSVAGLPAFGTLYDFGDGSGALSFEPVNTTPLGDYTMTATLSDGSLQASETFRITVVTSASQQPPALAAIGSSTVQEASPVSVSLTATDPDGDLLNWTFSLPGFANGVVLTNSGGSSSARLDLAPGYCDAGSYPASVSVSDGAMNDSESFTIVVSDRNRAPAWNAPLGGYALAVAAGSSGTLAVSASDPDQACNGPAPALSVVGSSGGSALQASLSGGVLQISASADAAGSYTVTLRAADGAYPATTVDAAVAVTVAPVQGGLAARAWTDSDPIRLDIGKPRERFYLEPVEGSFTIGSVVLASVQLSSEPGAGTVASIQPLSDRFFPGSDQDHNGATELRMEFSKEDLRSLLAFVDAGTAPLTLTASLTDGRTVTAMVSSNVVPERPRALKRVGPNPLNPEAVLSIHMATDGRLRVRVYDVTGRLVRTLVDDSWRAAGEHEIRFNGRRDDGSSLSSGRYYLRVEAASTVDTGSVTIMK
ncbi:MAG TPA: Ig-like domain-containing protein [Candidatus Eisenbacteria bacterium]|nr:Ig-like domain-containing protein [Candidatus Eisenbacteria bacterium]